MREGSSAITPEESLDEDFTESVRAKPGAVGSVVLDQDPAFETALELVT